jgi:hypothetical protein
MLHEPFLDRDRRMAARRSTSKKTVKTPPSRERRHARRAGQSPFLGSLACLFFSPTSIIGSRSRAKTPFQTTPHPWIAHFAFRAGMKLFGAQAQSTRRCPNMERASRASSYERIMATWRHVYFPDVATSSFCYCVHVPHEGNRAAVQQATTRRG